MRLAVAVRPAPARRSPVTMRKRPEPPRVRLAYSSATHHRRRRRTAAVVAVALVALAAGLAVGAGGGEDRAVARSAGGLPSGWGARVRALGGNGQLSLAFRQRRAENRAVAATLARTPYVREAGSQHREVALTFDDGPGPYTPQVLDILRRERVHATFFTVGQEVVSFHRYSTREILEGDAIGNHTWNHPQMSGLAASGQAAQVDQTNQILVGHGIPRPVIFRAPYGVWNAQTLALMRRERMLMVLWDVDTQDYEQPGADAIVQRAVGGAQPGSIILMHDGGGPRSQTVAALPRIISGLRKRGFRMVTVPRLLSDNPASARQQLPPPAKA